MLSDAEFGEYYIAVQGYFNAIGTYSPPTPGLTMEPTIEPTMYPSIQPTKTPAFNVETGTICYL